MVSSDDSFCTEILCRKFNCKEIDSKPFSGLNFKWLTCPSPQPWSSLHEMSFLWGTELRGLICGKYGMTSVAKGGNASVAGQGQTDYFVVSSSNCPIQTIIQKQRSWVETMGESSLASSQQSSWSFACKACISLLSRCQSRIKIWAVRALVQERSGRSKVCLQCTGEKQLLDLQGAANSRGDHLLPLKPTWDKWMALRSWRNVLYEIAGHEYTAMGFWQMILKDLNRSLRPKPFDVFWSFAQKFTCFRRSQDVQSKRHHWRALTYSCSCDWPSQKLSAERDHPESCSASVSGCTMYGQCEFASLLTDLLYSEVWMQLQYSIKDQSSNFQLALQEMIDMLFIPYI